MEARSLVVGSTFTSAPRPAAIVASPHSVLSKSAARTRSKYKSSAHVTLARLLNDLRSGVFG
jgi:hypothetical protein